MNKKGFTLIELLAVIVVIAIVSLISIPIVLNIIETARKGAIKSSAIGLMEAADIYYAKNISKIKEPIEFEINKGVQISTEKLEYQGKVNMGYLMLFKDNKKAVCVDDGTYSAHKGVNDKEVKVEEGICTGEYDEGTKSYYVSSTSSE